MTHRRGKGADSGPRETLRNGHQPDRGFALVEVLAASLILMVVVVSLSNLLVDSLSAALVARQREAAASIASDTIENAKAIGQAALTLGVSGTACAVPPRSSSVPIVTGCNIQGPYSTTLDNTTFTVSSVVGSSTTSADTITVTVRWPTGQSTSSYTTSGEVGT